MTSCIWLLGLNLLVIAYASGSPCESVVGSWYNQLGSELILSKTEDGKLVGEFRTAVEKHEGAAGPSYAVVRGVSKKDPFNHVVGFSAIFNGGTSATTWAGHCRKCGDEEELHTTWILRGQSEKCLDHWKAVMINEDVFRRHPTTPGPRKHMGQNTPARSSPTMQDTEETKPKSYKKLDDELKGKWYTSDGMELEITEISNDTIKGTLKRDDISKTIEISGNANENNVDGVFALSAVRDERNAVNVWVGQLHRCTGGKATVLQTSSLRLQGSSRCEDKPEPAGFRGMQFTRNVPSKSSDEGVWSNFASRVSGFFSNLIGR